MSDLAGVLSGFSLHTEVRAGHGQETESKGREREMQQRCRESAKEEGEQNGGVAGRRGGGCTVRGLGWMRREEREKGGGDGGRWGWG